MSSQVSKLAWLAAPRTSCGAGHEEACKVLFLHVKTHHQAVQSCGKGNGRLRKGVGRGSWVFGSDVGYLRQPTVTEQGGSARVGRCPGETGSTTGDSCRASPGGSRR